MKNKLEQRLSERHEEGYRDCLEELVVWLKNHEVAHLKKDIPNKMLWDFLDCMNSWSWDHTGRWDNFKTKSKTKAKRPQN